MQILGTRLAALLVVCCGFTHAAQAQFWKPKVKIDPASVRIGFRAVGQTNDGGTATTAKVGCWVPISFGLEYAGETRSAMKVEVSTMDGDGYRMTATYPIVEAIPETADAPAPGSKIEPTELTHTVYARQSGELSTVTLKILADDGSNAALSDTIQVNGSGPRSVNKYLILSLGTSLPGFTFKPKDGEATTRELREDRFLLARLDSVEEMPDNWFGYDSVDLLILPTGKADEQFLGTLLSSTRGERKRRALLEWVRRGGKLVLSTAARAELVRASTDFAKVLPALIGDVNREASVQLVQDDTQSGWLELKYKDRPAPRVSQLAVVGALGAVVLPETLPVTQLKPGPQPFQKLLVDGKKRPIIVQAALGLGRITLVAFDLDRSPFIDHPNRGEFWEWLIQNAGAMQRFDKTAKSADAGFASNLIGMGAGAEDGIAAALRKNTDSFEGVPVISFGWVALFILAYTIIIGPLEYILLKKVFGRLELTWITFPIIVLSVSAAAYFTAYALKGKDLRINKIDVVDVDMRAAQPRIYGRTWFTIFSPRIDSYTIGVEPKDDWGKATDENGYSPVPMVDWFGQTVQSAALNGGGSGRSYTVQINPLGDDRRTLDSASAKNLAYANGLESVPIQVWSTKAFTANWASLQDPAHPIIESNLRYLPQKDERGLPESLEGTVTLKVPVGNIQEAFVFYRGKGYALPNGLTADVPVNLGFNSTDAIKLDEFFAMDDRYEEVESGDVTMNPRVGGRRRTSNTVDARGAPGAAPLALYGLLFHDRAVGKVRSPQNASLRTIDQSWRLSDRNADEVILLAKVRKVSEQPEEIMNAPGGASPSKLWLKGLPGRDIRTPLPGVLQQETYLRFYLPIKPSGAK